MRYRNIAVKATRGHTGLTLVELLVVITILSIASSLIISGYLRERNRTLAYTAANNIAGWLEATRRSAERGSACLLTLYPSNNVTRSSTVATSAIDDGTTTSILNPCQSAAPLRLEASSDDTVFRISAEPVTTLVFTPRGTTFNPSDSNGDLPGPLRISVNVMRGSSIQLPTYCVNISPPMGAIDIVLSGTTTC